MAWASILLEDVSGVYCLALDEVQDSSLLQNLLFCLENNLWTYKWHLSVLCLPKLIKDKVSWPAGSWTGDQWMLQNKSHTDIFNQSKTRNYKIIYTTQELRIEFNRKTVSVSIRKNVFSNKD